MKYFKNLFVFDIETVPDIEAGRRLLGLENAENCDNKLNQQM